MDMLFLHSPGDKPVLIGWLDVKERHLGFACVYLQEISMVREISWLASQSGTVRGNTIEEMTVERAVQFILEVPSLNFSTIGLTEKDLVNGGFSA